MSEEQTNFKVTDRRLFNPDGTPRDVPPEERPEVKPEPPQPVIEAQAASAPPPEVADGTSQKVATAPEIDQPPATETDEVADLPGADDPASFASFLMSLASNAASSLGMMEHPVTGKREVDLELGKHWIDVLGMLKEKTRNNLLPPEQQILEGLLADLRMQYVSLTNATPPKASRTYSGQDITGG